MVYVDVEHHVYLPRSASCVRPCHPVREDTMPKQTLSSVGWMMLYVHRLIRDGGPGCPPRLSQCSWALLASTETIRLIRDGEPRTSTWSFTQLLSSGCHQWTMLPITNTWQHVTTSSQPTLQDAITRGDHSATRVHKVHNSKDAMTDLFYLHS